MISVAFPFVAWCPLGHPNVVEWEYYIAYRQIICYLSLVVTHPFCFFHCMNGSDKYGWSSRPLQHAVVLVPPLFTGHALFLLF